MNPEPSPADKQRQKINEFLQLLPLTLSIAMVWLAHIGIDRALGYGLKYSAGFNFTHLGRIGRRSDA